jgi:hypothetical protein
MPVVMRLIGWADGRPLACAGQYVRFVDVQLADITDRWLQPTADIRKAKVWRSVREAMETYHEILASQPVRPDMRPNRPLTAITIELIPLQEEDKTKETS